MNEKTSANLQEAFLNQVCQDKMLVTIYLVNGFQIRGVIEDFDSFTMLVASEQKQQLVYKHAVSTISPVKAETAFHREK